jgi:putative RecB family exonuclease
MSAEDDETADVAWALRALDDGRDGLTDDAGRLRLSFTRIDTYQNCPRRFRYQYVDGLPQAPAPQLSFGSSIHGVLEWLYDRKHPTLPTLEDTLQALFDRWDTTGYAELPREEQLQAYAHAREVIGAFHGRVLAEGFRLPAAVEAWFELPFPDEVIVVGAIDRIDVDPDGGLHVIDYKTNRRAKPRTQVRGSLQLAIYALATRELYGQLPRTVSLDFVVPGVRVSVPIEELDLAGVAQAVARTAAEIRARRDEPTPNRLCDWCDFRDLCPAWDESDGTSIGRARQEAARLRRGLARDVRRLRILEESLQVLESDSPDSGTPLAPRTV